MGQLSYVLSDEYLWLLGEGIHIFRSLATVMIVEKASRFSVPGVRPRASSFMSKFRKEYGEERLE